jgi:cytochrome P450
MGIAGVFSAEGEDWRPQRRLAVEALSQRHLGRFFTPLRTVTMRLLRRLQAAADQAEVVDVVELMKRYTVDVTVLLTFGYDINTLEHSGADIIQRQLEAIFPVLNRRAFAAVPLWRFIRLPSDRRMDRSVADLRDWLAGLMMEARSRTERDPERAPENFLEAMLVARDVAGLPFSNQMIFGNLVNMLLAGEDTTAYTLAWAVHHLCESGSAVAALGEELDRVLPDSAVPSSIEVTDRLTYCSAVANETMRLRPVAPLIFLEASSTLKSMRSGFPQAL